MHYRTAAACKQQHFSNKHCHAAAHAAAAARRPLPHIFMRQAASGLKKGSMSIRGPPVLAHSCGWSKPHESM